MAPGKWPIIGEREPAPSSLPRDEWTLAIAGEISRPVQFTAGELLARTLTTRSIDIHCVTRWSKLDVVFEGLSLRELLEYSIPNSSAQFVSFQAHSVRNHTTSLPLRTAIEQDTLIALKANGKLLEIEHGGPIRNIVPGRYFYKSVKWLTRIELLSVDQLGYWEAESGYHNEADPWKEQRYIASKLDRRETAALIASRDFSNRDLMGLLAADRNLSGLLAFHSLLRNADFSRSDLSGADFRNANLSNANLQSANLQNCNFAGADVEGANFIGANLSGANLLGCSMIGCSFFDAQTGEGSGAIFDVHTRVTAADVAPLFPEQFSYIDRRCRELGLFN